MCALSTTVSTYNHAPDVVGVSTSYECSMELVKSLYVGTLKFHGCRLILEIIPHNRGINHEACFVCSLVRSALTQGIESGTNDFKMLNFSWIEIAGYNKY